MTVKPENERIAVVETKLDLLLDSVTKESQSAKSSRDRLHGKVDDLKEDVRRAREEYVNLELRLDRVEGTLEQDVIPAVNRIRQFEEQRSGAVWAGSFLWTTLKRVFWPLAVALVAFKEKLLALFTA